MRIQLAGLLPGGLYSVFWGTLEPDPKQQLCPGVERTLPLEAVHAGAEPPDPNSFGGRRRRTAGFHGRAPGTLLDAGQVFFSIVYHFLAQTAYPVPSLACSSPSENCRDSFGEDSMRQLLILQKQ